MPPIGFIERLAAALASAATLLAFFFASPNMTLGLGVGGALGVLNFYALKALMRGITQSGKHPRQAVLSILLMFKFALMGTALFVLLNYTAVDGLGLLFGISAVVLAVLAEGFRLAMRGAKDSDWQDSDSATVQE
jgi:hypothetical protein